MAINQQPLRDTFDAVLANFAECATELNDEALESGLTVVAAHRQSLDEYAAMLAGEIGHRSRFELGYSGLAQRSAAATGRPKRWCNQPRAERGQRLCRW